MILRTKKSKHSQGTDSPSARQSQRIKMPHNSIFVLGPRTNREWLHGVRADKRPGQEKTDEEKAFDGERISITFRQISTFMDEKKKTIWGSGAKQNAKAEAGKIAIKDSAQMGAMINAFGKENHDVDFDWEAEYGSGFDVVNLVNEQAKLILCKDPVANLRVQLALCEKSISYTKAERNKASHVENNVRSLFWMHGLSNSENPVFQEDHEEGRETEGDLAIMFYLEEHHPFGAASDDSKDQPDRQTYISQTAQSNELLFLFRQISDPHQSDNDSAPTYRHNIERPLTPNESLMEEFHANLESWEARAREGTFIAGDAWTIIDCAFWPVLDHIWDQLEEMSDMDDYPNLEKYHQRVAERQCVRAVLESEND